MEIETNNARIYIPTKGNIAYFEIRESYINNNEYVFCVKYVYNNVELKLTSNDEETLLDDYNRLKKKFEEVK